MAGERTDLAELLRGLPEADWDRPTLCTGWRVREVVSHITMAYRIRPPRFVAGMIRAGGNFNRYADRQARQDAERLTSAELVECLQQNVDNPWKPPGGGFEGALSHDVIHGLDMTIALGIDRQVPHERVQYVLGALRPKHVKYFAVDLADVQLRATDLPWTFGTGRPLTGTAQDLLMVLSGRHLPPGHLSGHAADRFTAGVAR